MKVILHWAILILASLGTHADPLDLYNVVWDSPSANHHGSMPLGNGDIALNAWFTKEGDLHFYLAKTGGLLLRSESGPSETSIGFQSGYSIQKRGIGVAPAHHRPEQSRLCGL